MDKYYIYEDKLINSFLFIPKFLFSDARFKKLNIADKLMYSLYLERYSISQYYDEIGKYIIFTDEELMDKLYYSRRTCIRSRSKLEELSLIKVKKTTTYNKIYLLNCFNTTKGLHFFEEKDLDALKFYQFPRDFFDDTFKNLPLNAKMVYTVFLDTLSLSQMNYFVDESERIYFQETLDIQVKKLNISAPVIREARYMLMVCGLLLEYKTFTEDIRYYPLKLSHFIDRTEEYKKCSTAKEKKSYIEMVTQEDKQELILKPLKIGVKLKELRKESKMTQSDVINKLKELGYTITQQSYSYYERGKLHISKELYDICYKILTESKQSSQNTIPKQIKDTLLQDENKELAYITSPEEIFDTSKQSENKDLAHHTMQKQNIATSSQDDKKEMTYDVENFDTSQNKKVTSAKRKNSHINYTERNNTEKNYTKEFIELINNINNIINSSNILYDDKDYLIACFDSLRIYKKFYLNTSQELYTTKDLVIELSKLNNKSTCEKVFMNVLDRITTSGYIFKTPDAQINCFITFLLNELKKLSKEEEQPSWFNKRKFERLPERTFDFDEDVKNYKWWEE